MAGAGVGAALSDARWAATVDRRRVELDELGVEVTVFIARAVVRGLRFNLFRFALQY